VLTIGKVALKFVSQFDYTIIVAAFLCQIYLQQQRLIDQIALRVSLTKLSQPSFCGRVIVDLCRRHGAIKQQHRSKPIGKISRRYFFD